MGKNNRNNHVIMLTIILAFAGVISLPAIISRVLSREFTFLVPTITLLALTYVISKVLRSLISEL